MYGSEGASGYVIPRYRAPADAPWYHVLHGNIPGHQIDFMYCPEVPQGPLTTTHFSHLARLMKYIEPATGATHAFAIGNLSRDDTQHEPGHGAVGLIFGFRIGGAVDHAGRGNPPFAHGLVAVDRDLGYATLLEASATFYRHVMNATELNSSAGMFYREYVGAVREAPERVPHVLERYVEEYGDLPYLRRSNATWDWVADEGTLPKRVVIVHKHDEPFGAIAHAAARIATVLYRSNIKWTSITSGREADIPGGVSVRFVRERDVSMEERHGVLIRIEEVAEDEGEIARGMFGARPHGEQEEKPQFGGGWRERFAAQHAGTGPVHGVGGAMPGAALQERRAAPSTPPSQRAGLGRNDAHGPVRAGGGWAEAGAGAAAGAAGPASMSAAQQVGPKGTLVIDTEKLLGGTVRAAAPAGVGLAAPAVPVIPAQAAPLRGDLADEIPVIIEKPASSRKWLWAIVGLGLASLAAVAAVLVQRMPPANQDGGPVAGPTETASTPEVRTAPTASAAPGASSPVEEKKQQPSAAQPEAQQQQDPGSEKAQTTQGRRGNTKAPGASTAKQPSKRTPGKTPSSRQPSTALPEEELEF
ncbi:hypothetical protein [Sorangium sp. So ce388]|uniref:hypothetical protein n=1 Tax=Sorangium sp. So ce388 TaxID=3133309 RepID=UPI003F5B6737